MPAHEAKPNAWLFVVRPILEHLGIRYFKWNEAIFHTIAIHLFGCIGASGLPS
jgi:hypothetical protein